MKKLLVISPRWWNPASPDTQRVRTMLPYLGSHGWKATIVAGGGVSSVDQDAEIISVRPWPERVTKWVGVRSDAVRTLMPLEARLATPGELDRFDLAFFSTTAFPLWRLGPRWSRRGLPYVLDWQDPWFDDEPAPSVRSRPPGGRIKYRISQWSARRSERAVVREASAHVAVSSAYIEGISRRHGVRSDVPCVVEPFAADALALVAARMAPSPAFLAEGRRNWVCVGRLGEGFAPALDAFFSALANALGRVPAPDVQVTLVGTAYGPGAPAIATPLAAKHGIADRVTEVPERVAPEVALAALAQAELVLVFGSDDPRYVPSRLSNAVGVGRPVIVVSPFAIPVSWTEAIGGAEGVIACTPERLEQELAEKLATIPAAGHFSRSDFLALRSAEQMTARLVRVFDSIIASGARSVPS